MLYENYERKIKKLSAVRDWIVRRRLAITIMAAIVMALAVTLVSVKGVIYKDMAVPDSITYGEVLTYKASAIFAKVEYEYAVDGTEDWSGSVPVQAGTYKVRAVARRSFGAAVYGEENIYTIKPKTIELSFAHDKLEYGEIPELTGDTEYGDIVIAKDYAYGQFSPLKAEIVIDNHSVVIHDAGGKDVTGSYSFDKVEGEIALTPRLITIDTETKTKVFDGEPLEFRQGVDQYSIHGDKIPLIGHELTVVGSSSQTNAGTGVNELTFEVRDGDGVDYTDYYRFAFSERSLLIVTPRPVKVITEGAEADFDGEALTAGYRIDGLIDGHKAEVTLTGAQVRAGFSDNTVGKVVIKGGETDVTRNYEIIYEYGRLTVVPKQISVTTSSAEYVYNGEGQASAELTAADLIDGHIAVSVKDSYTYAVNVGAVSNKLTAAVKDSQGVDYTDCYTIEYVYGNIEITKRDVVVVIKDGILSYNGEYQNYDRHEVGAGLGLVSGHTTKVAEHITSIKDIGEKTGQWIIVTVTDANGVNVTANYNISYEDGTVEMVRRAVTVSTGTKDYEYDGAAHQYAELAESMPDLVSGHSVQIMGSSTPVTDVVRNDDGDVVGVRNIFAVRIVDGYGNDVSGNYYINYDYGWLKVTPRRITVATGDLTATYNGEVHEQWDYEIIGGGKVAGHSDAIEARYPVAEVSREGDARFGNVIGVDNRLGIGLTDGNGTDVTGNYDITYAYGLITIMPIEIHVTTPSESWVYDGGEHYSYKFPARDGLLTTHVFYEDSYSYIEDVGTIDNKNLFLVYDYVSGFDVTHNYELIYTYGHLTVTPRNISVVTWSQTWIYDGEAHSYPAGATKNSGNPNEGLAGEHKITVKDGTFSKITNVLILSDGSVGSIENRFEVEIFAGANDKTSNYNITYEYGTLKVNKRPVTIIPVNKIKEYDNTELKSSGITLTSPGMGLVTGHAVEAETNGRIIVPGVVANGITWYRIFSMTETNLNDNYQVTCLEGRLEVVARYVTITIKDINKKYDGTPLVPVDYDIGGKLLVEGHKFSQVILGGERTEPGSNDSNVVSYTILDEVTGEDVGHCYFVKTIEGDVHVWDREITYQTGSAKKAYDGTPLQYTEVLDTIGELREGDWLDVDREADFATRTQVGKTLNTFSIRIRNSEGILVTDHYKITLSAGWLIVHGNMGGNLNLDGTIDRESNGNGGSGGGEDIEKEVLFNATSDTSGNVYFRIKSFGDYEGIRWAEAEPYLEGPINALYLMHSTLIPKGLKMSKIVIEPVNNTLSYMIPYYADNYAYKEFMDDTEIIYDYYSSYSANYYSYEYNPADGLANTDYTDFEKAYYEYVKSLYLQLPNDTRSGLMKIAIANGWRATDKDIIAKVADTVQNTVTYSRNFGKYEGDVALYFFNGAEKGICQHYATAATAMFRALGIPARYTIGFVGQMSAGNAVGVSSEQGHAWVEVYIQGAGWIKVEVTGHGEGSGNGEGDGSHGGGSGIGGGGTAVPGEYSPLVLDIKPVDVFKKYDGSPLYAVDNIEGANLDTLVTLKSLLDNGYTYTVTVSGQRTEYGVSDSIINSFLLYDKYGRNVTNDYKVSYTKGRVRITSSPIIINVFSLQKYYDGQPLAYKSADYWIGNRSELPAELILNFNLQGTLTNAGILPLSSLESLTYQVIVNGSNLTDNYSLVFQGEPLRVDRRLVEITSTSAVKIYDGLPLTAGSSWVSKGSLVSGHSFDATVNGSITDIGSAPNTFSRLTLQDSNSINVMGNYRVMLKSGTLTVKSA